MEPRQKSSSTRTLQNPLTIFGLVFLAGDGPLVAAYTLTTDSNRAWVLLIATVIFIFGMAIAFCWFVAFRPRHLYAPADFPQSIVEKDIYGATIIGSLNKATEIVTEIGQTTDRARIDHLKSDAMKELNNANSLMVAYSLLLIPGYDVSLIADILEIIQRNDLDNIDSISKTRNITINTINTIIAKMVVDKLLVRDGEEFELTKKGFDLLTNLRKHMRLG